MAAPYHTDLHVEGKFRDGVFFGTRLVECDSADVVAVLEWYDSPANDAWPYPFGGWSQTALLSEATIKSKPGSQVNTTVGQWPLTNFEKAHLELVYTTGQMMDVGGIRVWEEIGPGLRQVPAKRPYGLLWANDSVPIQFGETQIQTHASSGAYKLHHFKLATGPSSLATVWGAVNSSVFYTASLGYSFPAGTMLCAGARVLRGSPGSCTSNWKQAHYTFYLQNEGWNKAWRPSTGQFEDMLLPSGAPYYPGALQNFTWTSLRY